MLPLVLFLASIAFASRLIIDRATGNYLVKPRGLPRHVPGRTKWRIVKNLNESRANFNADLLLQTLQLISPGSYRNEELINFVSDVMIQAEEAGEAWLVREVQRFAHAHNLFTVDPDRAIPSNGQDLLEPEKE